MTTGRLEWYCFDQKGSIADGSKPLDDHDIAEIVNSVVKIVKILQGADQLRDRVSSLLTPLLRNLSKNKAVSVVNKVST